MDIKGYTTADKAYREILAEVERQIELLRDGLDNMAPPGATVDLDWGNVGDLLHLVELLRTANAWLYQDDDEVDIG